MEARVKQVIVMIGTLILEKAGCIDQAVLESEVPVGFDILGMHHFNDLLYPAAQKIIEFRIRPGGIEEPDPIQFPFINIKGMEALIKTGFHHRRKKQ
jgi:hypothetical protein